jgi:transketolase C-terminal domain/subunit
VIEASSTLNDWGISSQVLSLLQIDLETFQNISKLIPKNALVVVVEEHIAPGGLASQFSLYLMKSGMNHRFLHFCLPTLPSHLYGSQNWLLDQLGLSSRAISNRIRSIFS